MKHSLKVTILLISLFLAAQLVGLYVSHAYAPQTVNVYNNNTGSFENKTVYNLPYGVAPPENVNPWGATLSISIALVIAVLLMLSLMSLKAEVFLRIWFFGVVTFGIALGINAFIINLNNSAIIALAIALPLAVIKVFKRNIIVHNLTEIIIYPGIASVFIPILTVWTTVILFLIISVYDIYAVWHAGFMQKMAKYQIEKVRVFSGLFVPYIAKKDRLAINQAKASGKKGKKVAVNVAILGGGDIVFPIILAGVVLRSLGLLQALIISLGATIALSVLFYFSEKGKFYPAMPFISAGCLIALGIAYLV